MRNATGLRGLPAAVSISRFSDCRGQNAMPCARCMRSCGWWTTCPTRRATSNRNDAGWRNGARNSMRPPRGARGATPVLPALADTITRFEIPTRYFHDLISGAEMDLTVASYATFDRLSEYCYRVAGTVGLTCLYVFGFRDPRSPDLAERLGPCVPAHEHHPRCACRLRDGPRLSSVRRYRTLLSALRRICAGRDAEAAGSAGVRGGTRLAALRRGGAARGSVDADSRATLRR